MSNSSYYFLQIFLVLKKDNLKILTCWMRIEMNQTPQPNPNKVREQEKDQISFLQI